MILCAIAVIAILPGTDPVLVLLGVILHRPAVDHVDLDIDPELLGGSQHAADSVPERFVPGVEVVHTFVIDVAIGLEVRTLVPPDERPEPDMGIVAAVVVDPLQRRAIDQRPAVRLPVDHHPGEPHRPARTVHETVRIVLERIERQHRELRRILERSHLRARGLLDRRRLEAARRREQPHRTRQPGNDSHAGARSKRHARTHPDDADSRAPLSRRAMSLRTPMVRTRRRRCTNRG